MVKDARLRGRRVVLRWRDARFSPRSAHRRRVRFLPPDAIAHVGVGFVTRPGRHCGSSGLCRGWQGHNAGNRLFACANTFESILCSTSSSRSTAGAYSCCPLSDGGVGPGFWPQASLGSGGGRVCLPSEIVGAPRQRSTRFCGECCTRACDMQSLSEATWSAEGCYTGTIRSFE